MLRILLLQIFYKTQCCNMLDVIVNFGYKEFKQVSYYLEDQIYKIVGYKNKYA